MDLLLLSISPSVSASHPLSSPCFYFYGPALDLGSPIIFSFLLCLCPSHPSNNRCQASFKISSFTNRSLTFKCESILSTFYLQCSPKIHNTSQDFANLLFVRISCLDKINMLNKPPSYMILYRNKTSVIL